MEKKKSSKSSLLMYVQKAILLVVLIIAISIVVYRVTSIDDKEKNSIKEIKSNIIVDEKEIVNDNVDLHINYLPKKSKNLGMNILDGKSYEHSIYLRQIPIEPYVFSYNEYRVDLNGLKIPKEIDCNNLNNGHSWNKRHDNFFLIPSRWYSCYMHEAVLKSGLDQETPQYPIIDEDYPILVATVQSTLRARDHFVLIEVGAGWGYNGARAIKNLQALNNMNYNLFFIEPDSKSCEGIESVMNLNNIKYELKCTNGFGSTQEEDYIKQLTDWAATQKHIDLIKFDIPGSEKLLIPNLKDVFLDSKAYRVIIKTHNIDAHNQLKTLIFDDWKLLLEMPNIKPECMEKVEVYLRGQYDENNESRFSWFKLIDDHCFVSTHWGKISNYDGLLVFDNKIFLDESKAFSFSDTVLNINDLKI